MMSVMTEPTTAAVLFAATPPDVDPWGWGWDSLVGLGTLLLALGTVLLAGFTFALARRTKALAMAAAEDSRAQWRPVVLAGQANMALNSTPEGRHLMVMVRNRGRGPALHVRTRLEFADASTASITHPDHQALGLLAADDDWALSFRLPASELGAGAQLLIDYRDLAGNPYSTALTITQSDRGLWLYDVRTWDGQAVAAKDTGYPLAGLRDATPRK
jgi:hypothetical protein